MSSNYKYNIIISRFNREGKTHKVFEKIFNNVKESDKEMIIRKLIEKSDSYNLVYGNCLIIKLDALPFVRYSYVIEDLKNYDDKTLKSSIFFFQITNIVMSFIFSLRKNILKLTSESLKNLHIDKINKNDIFEIESQKLVYYIWKIKKCLQKTCKIEKNKKFNFEIYGNKIGYFSDTQLFKNFVELYDLLDKMKLYFKEYMENLLRKLDKEKIEYVYFIIENIDRIKEEKQKIIYLCFLSMFFDIIESISTLKGCNIRIFIEDVIKNESNRNFSKSEHINYNKLVNIFNMEIVSGYDYFFNKIFNTRYKISINFDKNIEKYILPLDIVYIIYNELRSELNKCETSLLRIFVFLLVLIQVSYITLKTFENDIDIYDAMTCFKYLLNKIKRNEFNPISVIKRKKLPTNYYDENFVNYTSIDIKFKKKGSIVFSVFLQKRRRTYKYEDTIELL